MNKLNLGRVKGEKGDTGPQGPKGDTGPQGPPVDIDIISQAEAEAGESTEPRTFTAQRVRQAIVAWFNGISGAIGRTILTRTTAAQVRSDIGLGTSATANLTTSSVDGTAGMVLKVSDRVAVPLTVAIADLNDEYLNRFLTASLSGGRVNSPWPGAVNMISMCYASSGSGRVTQIANSPDSPEGVLAFRSSDEGGTFHPWWHILHTGNTTIDPDGTLKASSPVINLYTDKHDSRNEGQFGATPAVTRKSKGVYEITGTLGLRSEGWYLDTPSDRNGNKYFNIEWTQNITPDAADGVVDEYRDNIVVTIETFERVWNKDTGVFDNGEPIDINDLQDRFVQLRFNEIKSEHEELVDDSN